MLRMIEAKKIKICDVCVVISLILIILLSSLRSSKTANLRDLLTEVMKRCQAGCVSSAVLVTEVNKTCLPSSTWEKSTTAHSRPSCLDRKCWCGTMKSTHSILVSPAQFSIWVLWRQKVIFYFKILEGRHSISVIIFSCS